MYIEPWLSHGCQYNRLHLPASALNAGKKAVKEICARLPQLTTRKSRSSAAQDPAHTVLGIPQLRLNELARVSISCAASDLQCTGWNQPSRISCPIPRA